MIYFNFIRCVVYKFTASLPQIRYKGRITFKSVNSLYYSVKSPVPVKEKLLFKSGIKVAAPPPPPISNINNSYFLRDVDYSITLSPYTLLHTANHHCQSFRQLYHHLPHQVICRQYRPHYKGMP